MAENGTVTVIGLGLMGSAVAHAFLRAGHDLTVWNRTPERAARFQGLARIATDVREACAASDTIVVCVRDYEVSNALLHTAAVEEVTSGKALVQLTTGTAADARASAAWARQHGLAYLDGAILAGPGDIGGETSSILCAGEATVYEEHRTLLGALGQTTHCGEEIGAAATLDMAFCEVGMPRSRRSFMAPHSAQLSWSRWIFTLALSTPLQNCSPRARSMVQPTSARQLRQRRPRRPWRGRANIVKPLMPA